MWTVILLKEVEDWYLGLDDDIAEAVAGAIDVLEERGPQLGRPLVDRVKKSHFHNMKELRPASTSIRVLFVFDPKRQAVLLVAGDKAGQWNAWYDEKIPLAEARFEDWLKEQGGG